MKPHIPSHQAYTYKPVYTANNPLFLLAFLLVLLPTWVSAQITGRVVDTAGNSLEGVHISTLQNEAETTSGADGSFSLELLEDPVGILGQDFLGRNALSAQGSHLQMNLHSGQLEVYTQSGVYDLQGKFLRVAEDAGVFSHGEKGALRKALAQADTLVFVKSGYVTARIEITDDAVNLGEVVLETTIGSFTDSRDGKVYRTTTIGTQTWMAENLNYEPSTGSYCYDDDPANCDTYGRLYTWAAAMAGAPSSSTTPSGVQGICPEGWHVPSDAEWTILSDYVIANTAGTSTRDIGLFFKATSGWDTYSGITSDDAFGFSGLGGGIRSLGGHYGYIGQSGDWWSSTESNSSTTYIRYLGYYYNGFLRGNYDKSNAYSLRCLQNDSEAPVTYTLTFDSDGGSAIDPLELLAGASITPPAEPTKAGHTFTGWSPALPATMPSEDVTVTAQWEFVIVAGTFTDTRDGKEYRSVTIGTQTWMAENLDFGIQVAGTADQSDATITSVEKYCYANNEANCDTYGGLYQWHSAMALPFECNSTDAGTGDCIVNTPHRGICPQGWHVPTRSEWATLGAWVDSANGGSTDDEGNSLKSTNLWSSGGAGTDAYGWSGLPGGYRYNGVFSNQSNDGYWWSGSQYGAYSAWYRSLYFGYGILSEDNYYRSKFGFSLRCLQDH
jgi:uncharacterized protein (TIGR02145 family)